jgi:uncharacterized DUF497 family protein
MYNLPLFTWTEQKRAINIRKHKVDFEDVEEFDFATAHLVPDLRRDYGENRYFALGTIGRRLHYLAFTVRGAEFHIISLRKANRREEKFYVGQN